MPGAPLFNTSAGAAATTPRPRAPAGFIIHPNAPGSIANRNTTAAYRPPPIRGSSFRPPRLTEPTSQATISTPPTITHDFHGGPMTFIPTPSMPRKPNGKNNAE